MGLITSLTSFDPCHYPRGGVTSILFPLNRWRDEVHFRQVSEPVLNPSFLTVDFMLILLHQAVLKEHHFCQYIDYKGLPGGPQKYGNKIILWELKFKTGPRGLVRRQDGSQHCESQLILIQPLILNISEEGRKAESQREILACCLCCVLGIT